ncbi:MAG TPA: alpha/beta hydrolase, partial [Pyrinomonadaceae bacterium]|nr:alpha/beta hydrolase [Pyrinomonadaceae bacterium]
MAFIKLNDIQIAYTDAGIGRPVVLIHGYPFNRSLWNEQVEALSSTCRVIAPDLRGFGESDAAATASMNEMAQDVAMLLNQLGIVRATIAGLSMGGYVAL